MDSLLNISSLTCEEFCNQVYALFGRGKRHAKALYKAYFQDNEIKKAFDPKEPQSHELLFEIEKVLAVPSLHLSHIIEEGATKKFLLKLSDNLVTESVCIPMKSGVTLCISSQVGCKMGCAFCETGKMGLLRNLTVEEIVGQVFFALHYLNMKVRNIVFMGMGEPFDNYANVMQAIKVLTDPSGMGLGKRRITVSTSGLVDKIYQFADEADPAINLAVSVNASSDEIRRKLMPVNKSYDMTALKEAMQYYCSFENRKILVEYVLLKDINDSIECAEDLLNYLDGLSVKVNLIPYNPQSRDRFSPPSMEVCERFLNYLRSKGMTTLLRTTKGQKIMAACGQLGNLLLRKQFLEDQKLKVLT